MIAELIRKQAFLNWRLCLQTSGIYRDLAIPGCKGQPGSGAALQTIATSRFRRVPGSHREATSST